MLSYFGFFFFFCRSSNEPKSNVLADIELQFVSDELDPVKHLRAIVSDGHISGMMVYPDYFVVLGGNVLCDTYRNCWCCCAVLVIHIYIWLVLCCYGR